MRALGVILIALGAVAIALLYAYRPPNGLGYALTMALNGRISYLRPPVYYTGLALSSVSILVGLISLVRKNRRVSFRTVSPNGHEVMPRPTQIQINQNSKVATPLKVATLVKIV